MHPARYILIVLMLIPAANVSAAELSVGAARAVITPALPFPLAGYGERFPKLATEINDDVAATALVIRSNDVIFAMVSADLCGVSDELRTAVCDRIEKAGSRVPRDHLLLAGTHTHNGPGGYGNHPIWIPALGVYQQRIFDHLANHIASSVLDAESKLAPTTISWQTGPVKGFQQNRRGDDALDETMTVIRFFGPDGDTRASIVHYTGHPTILTPRDMRAGRDWPGALADQVASDSGAPCLVFNGALGDVRVDLPAKHPMSDETRYAQAESTGKALAVEARQLVMNSPAHPAARVNVIAGPCAMPVSRFPKLLPPRRSISQRIELGGLWLLTVPGEPSCAIGLDMKRQASELGAKHAVVIALANDHLGYFVTPAQHAAGGYETSMSFYGPDTAAYLKRATLGDLMQHE